MRPDRFAARAALVLALLIPGAAGAADGPVTVTARPAAEVFIAIERSAPATATMTRRTRVAARLATPVESALVEVGDEVEAGDPLVRLECVDATDARDAARARLGEAEALARLARLQLERLRRLRQQDAVSAEELDRAETEYAARSESVTARAAELARARRDVERCEVTAPVSGMVTARHRSAGDFVQPGTPLVTLVAPQDIEVSAHITADDAETLADATAIELRAGGRRHPLAAPRRTGVVDPATRTEEFRLRFVDTRPLPGQAGRVHWRSRRAAIPADLLVEREAGLGVFVVRDERAHFRPLAGAVEGRPALTDLPGDTRIVVEGRYALAEGMRLEIVE